MLAITLVQLLFLSPESQKLLCVSRLRLKPLSALLDSFTSQFSVSSLGLSPCGGRTSVNSRIIGTPCCCLLLYSGDLILHRKRALLYYA